MQSLKFYIDGAWVDPISRATIDVVDPTTEQAFARIAAGDAADVDRAVQAARRAFESFQFATVKERQDLLRSIVARLRARAEDIAQAIRQAAGKISADRAQEAAQ